jgi:hypothetical protein
MPKKRRLRVDRKLKFGSILNSVVLILLLLLTPAAVSAESGDPPFLINEALASNGTLGGSVDTLIENDQRAESARRLKTNRQDRTPAWNLNAAVTDRIGAIRSQIHRGVAPKQRMTDEQRDNLQRLNAQSGQNQPLQVLFNQENGTPAFLKTKPMAAGRARRGEQGIAQAERAARHFLRSNRQLLKLSHPDSEMALSSAWSDDKGASHFKYQQMVDGIAVFGKKLIVHVDAAMRFTCSTAGSNRPPRRSKPLLQFRPTKPWMRFTGIWARRTLKSVPPNWWCTPSHAVKWC